MPIAPLAVTGSGFHNVPVWRHFCTTRIQRGNGLDRCRDRSEVGLERYLGLGVLSRNMQVLGKLLISREVGNIFAGYRLREAG